MHFSLRSCRIALVAAVFAAASAVYAHADTLLVTESGTFSSSTPVSSFSAPNGTYSISFNISSTPVVTASSDHFDVNYSNFKFLLNGVASTTPTAFISFYNDADDGLFSVCFSTACPVNSNPSEGFALLGAQAYSGTLTNPTILTGSYALSGSTLMVGDSAYTLTRASNANITNVAATPEPSSLMLLGTGLLGLAGAVRRRSA